MKFDRQESAGYLVNYMARLFARALERRIGPHGVRVGQFPVLLLLWEREGVTQADLVEALGVEQPTMASTLKRMERDGLIERIPDAEDRRRARIYLTERGRALEAVLTASARETHAVALGGMEADEIARFLRGARRIIEKLEKDSRAHGSHPARA